MNKTVGTGIIAFLLIFALGCGSQNSNSQISSKNTTQATVQAQKTSTNFGNNKILNSIPKYNPNIYNGWQVDLRGADLSNCNLSDNVNDLLNSEFDSRTKWPSNLPNTFNPGKIMELAKNSGLGIRNIQDEGITGNGINVAIIDRSLLVDHIEYVNRIKVYKEINYSNNTPANFHSCAVTSIAYGKTIGVAPGANIYYIGCPVDISSRTNAIDSIIEINRSLPKGDKIRVLSIASGWGPADEGYYEFSRAISKAVNEGIFVITADIFETYGFYFYGLETDALSDRDNPSSFQVVPWSKWIYIARNGTHMVQYYQESFKKDMPKEQLLIPIGCKTTASPSGTNDYVFYKTSGWSWGIPYIAGLYTLACQVKSDITPQIFWNIALKTGDARAIVADNNQYTGKIVNPQRLFEALKALK